MAFEDDGTFAGLERVRSKGTELLATQKQLTAAELQALTAEKKTADAQRASTLATKAGSDAARSAAQAKLSEARAANADEMASSALARAQAQLAAATSRATREHTLSEKALRENTEAMRRQADATESINKQLNQGVSAVKAFFAAWAVREALSGMRSIITTGVEFNALMETSRLGIAALVSGFGEIRDMNGRLLTGVEQWNAANRIALRIQKDLRLAALQTSAEYGDMLRALQEGVGPAIRAGFDPAQIVKFTQAVTQAAAAMGLPFNQLGQEIRGIMEGDQNARVSRISAQLFSGMDNVPAKLAELQKSGELFEFLMVKLEAFKRAGEEAANTFSGALSNLKDAIEQACGDATQGATSDLTRLIKELTAQIVHFDEAGDAEFNENFIKGVKALGEAVVITASKLVTMIEKIDEFATKWRAIRALAGEPDNAVSWTSQAVGMVRNPNEAIGLTGPMRAYMDMIMDPTALSRAITSAAWDRIKSDIDNRYGEIKATEARVEEVHAQVLAARGQALLRSVSEAPPNMFGPEAPPASSPMWFRPGWLQVPPARPEFSADPSTFGGRQVRLEGVSPNRAAVPTGLEGMRLPSFSTDFGQQKFLEELGEFSGEHDSTKLKSLFEQINKAVKDGVLTLMEFRAAKEVALTTETLDGKGGTPGLTGAQNNALDSFRRFMEPFRQHAAAGDTDEISQKLLEVDIQRAQAISKLEQTRKKLAGANEDWERDLADINATFDARQGDILDKAFADFGKFADWAQQYDPAPPDPLTQDLTKIEKERADALRKLEEQKKALGGIAAVDWQGLQDNINTHFDQEAKAAEEKRFTAAHDSLRAINELTVREVRENAQLTAKIQIDAQAEAEAGRIALITDSISRELAQRRAANDRWAAQEKARIETTYKNEVQRKKALAIIDQALLDAQARAEAEAQRARESQIAGTEAWMNGLAQRIADHAVPIGLAIQDAVVAGLDGVSNAIDELFDSVGESQLDLGGTLQGLQESLESTWSKVLSSMITNTVIHGASLKEQFNQIFAGISGPGSAFMAGAGIGGTIGGFFQEPGNMASEGGAIGGAIGAALGAAIAGYFSGGMGAAGGAKIGTMIGSAIGTWIGAGIQKGEDSIQVRITNATLAAVRGGAYRVNTKEGASTWGFDNEGGIEIEEQGIDESTRVDILTQVRRRVRDVMKGYDSILELLPQHVRDALAELPPPRLDLSGGVEEGDLGDENALSSLGDFLNQKLGKAAFTAYSGAIRKGLEMMGLNDGAVKELFTEWGILQGEELQRAVATYVATLVEFSEIRGKIGADETTTREEAKRRGAANNLSHLGDISDELKKVFDTLDDGLDVDDKLAAMQRLNDLSGQFYESMQAALMAINQREDAMHESFARQREQIELAGMTKQEKMDYYYQQMTDLRNNIGHETDPEKISEMMRRLQEYIAAAMGLDPENEENRQKLLDILGDMEDQGSTQYDKARDEVIDKQKEAADLLREAARLLLEAAGGGDDDGPGTSPGDGTGPPVYIPDPGGDPDPDPYDHEIKAILERTERTAVDNGARVIELLSTMAEASSRQEERAADIETRRTELADMIAAMPGEIRLRIELTGDGADFLNEMGLRLRNDTVLTVFDLLRNLPDAARRVG
jgi:hypothetical protein